MTPSEAVALAELRSRSAHREDVDVAFRAPATDIIPVAKACEGTNIAVGAGKYISSRKVLTPARFPPPEYAGPMDAGVNT